MAYSDYKAVQSGTTPGSVKGLLPLDEAATAFRYRKELILHVNLGSFANTAYQILVGKWHVQILDHIEGTVLFEQEVTWRAGITAFVDPLFGTIGMMTWQPLDNGDGIIVTTRADGSPVDPPGTAWQYVDTTRPTEFVEFGNTLFTAEGIVTAGTFDFQATWLSPAYNCAIPPGAILRVVSDSWGIGSLDKRATFAFGFKLGGGFSSMVDVPGLLFTCVPQGLDLVLYDTQSGPGLRRRRAHLHQARDGSLSKDNTNRLWLTAVQGPTGHASFRPFYSLDNGGSLRPLLLEIPGSDPVAVVIFSEDYKYPRHAGLRGGGAVAVAQLGGFLWVRDSPDWLTWTPSRKAALARRSEAYELHERELDGALVLTNSKDHVLESFDRGYTWKEVE